jgi:hypothetical protein
MPAEEHNTAKLEQIINIVVQSYNKKTGKIKTS